MKNKFLVDGGEVTSSRRVQIGARVRILEPDYVAEKIGTVLGREVMALGECNNRWLIQVVSEDVIVSLTPDEFIVLS